MSKNRLSFAAPASLWEEAIPLGNGKLGAMVFGGVTKERIALNYDELWTGFPRDENKPNAYQSFFKARDAAMGNDLLLSQQIIEEEITSANVQAYMPLGDLLLTMPSGMIRGYRRFLDIDRAKAEVTYAKNGASFRWEYITSHPAKCLLIRVTANQPGNLIISAYDPIKEQDILRARESSIQRDYVADENRKREQNEKQMRTK